MSRGSESAVSLVASWSLEQMLWSPRSLAMSMVALSTPALALLYRFLVSIGVEPPLTGYGFFSAVTATLGFQFVAPVLALVYSSGVLIDEIDTGRLPYLITRPRSRGHVLAGKMIGSYLLQVLFFVPSLVLGFYIAVAPSGWTELGARFPVLALDAGVALLGLAAYSGLFALLGTVLRRPVLVGLVFVFGWQAAATYVPGFVRRLTIAHYLQSLLPHESFQGALAGLLGSRSPGAVAAPVLLVVAFATHALALAAFSRKEFPGRV